MRLCIFGSAESIHVRRWGEHLAAAGHEVHILSNAPAAIPGCRVWSLSSTRRFGRLAYPLSLIKVPGILHRVHPELVHFHYLGGQALYAPLVRGARIIASPWGSDIYTAGPLHRLLVRSLLRRADRVTTTSAAMARTMLDRFAVPTPKIVEISWGIDTELFAPLPSGERAQARKGMGIPEDAFVVFSGRAMKPLYRTETVVQAFVSARRTLPILHLILLRGSSQGGPLGRYQDHVCSLARSEDGVTILEHGLSPSEMATALAVSDVAVSIPTSDQRASSVLEALAVCPAIVASDLPAYRELVGEGYRLQLLTEVTAHTAAEAILDAHRQEHGERREAQQMNRKLILENEDWQAQAAKMAAVYAEAARR